VLFDYRSETLWITLNDGRSVRPRARLDQETGFGLVQALASSTCPRLKSRLDPASMGERVVVGGFGGRQRSVAARIVAKQEFAGYWNMCSTKRSSRAAHPNWRTALIGPAGELSASARCSCSTPPEGQTQNINI